MSDDRRCVMCGKRLSKKEERVCSGCESINGRISLGILGAIATAIWAIIKVTKKK